jgi:conjugal transfer ATP-binding protein TraC
MSLFKPKLQTVPPTEDILSIDEYDQDLNSGGGSRNNSKPKKWEFWKKDQEVELTKEYLYHYNQKRAKLDEKKLMNSITENNREMVINDTFSRIYNLIELPEVLAYHCILAILNSGIPLSLSYQIKSTNKFTYINMLRTRKAVLTGSQSERQRRGSDNDPNIEKEINEVEALIEEMVNDGKKVFLVSLYVVVTGKDRDSLIENCNEFEDLTSQRELSFAIRTFTQKQTLPSVLPLAKDTASEKVTLQTDAVVELFPFLSRNIKDNSGFYLGVSTTNYNSPIIFDPFSARNANMLILGTSGSGKSVTSKSLLLKLVMRQVQCIILDPEGEYNEITQKCGGQSISFGEKKGLNIFDIEFRSEESRRNHIVVLKNFFKFVIDESKYSDSELDELITKFYKMSENKDCEVKKSKSKPNSKNSAKSSNLSMKDFVALAKSEKVAFARDLLKLTEGSMAGIFDSTESLDLNNAVINFDLSNLGSYDLKLPAMYIIASIVDNLIDRADKKRMIFIDEAHLFLNRDFTREFYIRLQKTARKRQAGVVSITQNAEDFREESGAKTILTQAETVILLKQHIASVNFLQNLQIFDLSKDEFNRLYTFEQGEAILFREQEHINIQIEPFENEWEVIKT